MQATQVLATFVADTRYGDLPTSLITECKIATLDVFAAAFSPSGKHVALVGSNYFVVANTGTGKLVQRFRYAKGTADSPDTKAIRLTSDDEALYFDGCQLHRSTLSKDAKPQAIDECVRHGEQGAQAE